MLSVVLHRKSRSRHRRRRGSQSWAYPAVCCVAVGTVHGALIELVSVSESEPWLSPDSSMTGCRPRGSRGGDGDSPVIPCRGMERRGRRCSRRHGRGDARRQRQQRDAGHDGGTDRQSLRRIPVGFVCSCSRIDSLFLALSTGDGGAPACLGSQRDYQAEIWASQRDSTEVHRRIDTGGFPPIGANRCERGRQNSIAGSPRMPVGPKGPI